MLQSTSPPLPVPPSPQLKPLASPPVPSTAAAAAAATVSSSVTFSYSPSLLIITAIIILVGLASFAIHLLLRLLPRRHPSQLVDPRSSLSLSSFRAPGPVAADLVGKEKEKKDRDAAIESLPVFTLASALAAAPKSAADCAVCLSRFRPHDELRLLPACCHAFHQSCVDVWLHTTPSCPLCRASIYLPPTPPLQQPPPLQAPLVNSSITTTTSEHQEAARSGSFRIEFGSVSRRRSNITTSDGEAHLPPGPLLHGRRYSLGSAYEYLVEEEVEAVVARALRRPISKEQKQEDHDRRQPQSPGSDVAEAAGGSSRGGASWLRDYIDRLASSASSSFSSLRFSSRRFGSSFAADEELWDTEENHHRNPTAAAAEDVGVSSVSSYKWIMGVRS